MKIFLHLYTSFTEINFATREFKRTKAFARFKTDVWCMDLAYVRKQAEDNNNLLKSTSSSRPVGLNRRCKRNENKRFLRNNLSIFVYDYKKTIQKNWIDKGTNFAGCFKNVEKLTEYKFTLQWTRLRLNLLNVQNDLWKIYFNVTWKIMETIIIKNCLNSSKPWIPEKHAWQTWHQSMSRFRTFRPFYSKPLREHRKPKFKTEDRIRISYNDLRFVKR